ncbi:hypothetical protein QR680_000145 [Steinernema hermaphroditum]|uniref:Ammonium transporter AmtB-like domain-containing protein n=1 Tax=Steinernema hermaphroditum TaxID=289476 RepID=A0AA39GVK2_9BILA|nr:hypothetical protein QR680_000145 [Steinernema hermaphroditum]
MNGLNQSTYNIVQQRHYADLLPYSAETEKLYQDDAVWIITSSFIIFTMHSGFGLLESGSVSAKDEVNIMIKNVVDVVFGGLAYWAFGYGLSYGDDWENPIIGWGKFFYDPSSYFEHELQEPHKKPLKEGWSYASFLFDLSLSTTASTIVSGAVAERAKLKSYIVLGCVVVLIQALPAHWIWDDNGFFYHMGVIDFAGCASVHMVGGVIGLMATLYLKPRRNRFEEDSIHQMSSPTNALLGTFMLWWGWFGINSGSAWGITNGRWRLGARAAVATIMSSVGGGATAIVISFVKTKKLQVNHLINGLLASIVSITALCGVARPWHALVIGSVSAMLSIAVLPLLEKLKIDDPVGIVPIHMTSSIWGMFAVGIFAEEDAMLTATKGKRGLIYSWDPTLLGIQMLCTVTIIAYSAIVGLLSIVIISKSPLGLRVTDYEEQIGADVVEHGLSGTNIARYHLEKPMNKRVFATVTKAITKWKMLAKSKSRSKRMALATQKIEERNRLHALAMSNGHVHPATPNALVENEVEVRQRRSVTPPQETQAVIEEDSQSNTVVSPVIPITANGDAIHTEADLVEDTKNPVDIEAGITLAVDEMVASWDNVKKAKNALVSQPSDFKKLNDGFSALGLLTEQAQKFGHDLVIREKELKEKLVEFGIRLNDNSEAVKEVKELSKFITQEQKKSREIGNLLNKIDQLKAMGSDADLEEPLEKERNFSKTLKIVKNISSLLSSQISDFVAASSTPKSVANILNAIDPIDTEMEWITEQNAVRSMLDKGIEDDANLTNTTANDNGTSAANSTASATSASGTHCASASAFGITVLFSLLVVQFTH